MRSLFGNLFIGRLVNVFNEKFQELEKSLREYLTEAFETALQWFFELITQAENDEDFEILKSFVNSSKEKVRSIELIKYRLIKYIKVRSNY